VSFGGGASSDPNAGDTIASWVFDFGDGTPPVTRVTPDVSHVYAATGTFTASLTVTDNHGLASTNAAQLTITVTPNLPPTARLTASVTSGTAPLTVGFDASASSDPDSGDTLTYTMTFGDGTSPTTNTTPAFRHTYEEPGGYTASLIVTDSSGQESDNTAAIIINVLPDSVAGAPAITDVDVTSCDGTSSLTLIVTGVNLAPASVIQVNGADRATTYVSSSRMRISIFASDLGLNRTVTLRVVNPDRRTSETTTATIVRPADVTLDGSVDAQDLVIVANYLVGNVTPGTAPFAAPLSLADVNHDTAVDVVDIVVLANHLVGNISCLSTD
jgi:PKD repeat protein